MEGAPKSNLLNGPEKVLRIEVWYFGKQIPMPLSSTTSVPADCLEKVVNRKSHEKLNERTQLTATGASKRTLFEVLGKHITQAPRVDMRFQGVTPQEPQQGGHVSPRQQVDWLQN